MNNLAELKKNKVERLAAARSAFVLSDEESSAMAQPFNLSGVDKLIRCNGQIMTVRHMTKLHGSLWSGQQVEGDTPPVHQLQARLKYDFDEGTVRWNKSNKPVMRNYGHKDYLLVDLDF